jgi:NAD-dependent deacetylase
VRRAGKIRDDFVRAGDAAGADAPGPQLTLAADLFLVVGSSLVVFPAATFPLIAKRNGAKLVIVNREPTELDAVADLVVRAEIGQALGRLAG